MNVGLWVLPAAIRLLNEGLLTGGREGRLSVCEWAFSHPRASCWTGRSVD